MAHSNSGLSKWKTGTTKVIVTRMNRKVYIVILSLLVLIGVMYVFSIERDFTDKTVIIESFDYDNKLIVLVDSDGKTYSGSLYRVTLPSASKVKKEVLDLVQLSMKDSIAYSEDSDRFIIWYQTSLGKRNLNYDIRRIVNAHNE